MLYCTPGYNKFVEPHSGSSIQGCDKHIADFSVKQAVCDLYSYSSRACVRVSASVVPGSRRRQADHS